MWGGGGGGVVGILKTRGMGGMFFKKSLPWEGMAGIFSGTISQLSDISFRQP